MIADSGGSMFVSIKKTITTWEKMMKNILLAYQTGCTTAHHLSTVDCVSGAPVPVVRVARQ